MNKGLEVIEAHHLFGVDYRPDRGRRPPAVVRALDGRVRRRQREGAPRRDRHAHPHPVRVQLSAQLGAPLPPVDFAALGHLDFAEPDVETFRLPAARAGRRAGRAARCRAALNAANEVAVAAFLGGRSAGSSASRRPSSEVLDAHERAGARERRAARGGRRLGARASGSALSSRRRLSIEQPRRAVPM